MKTQTQHGVFLDIFGLGVLLIGPSGVGKSEVALSLINREHRLIADDAIEFELIDNTIIVGRCPSVLQDFLEVRGLGILNIRAMFGDIALRPSKRLELVVKLIPLTDKELQTIDRLQGVHKQFMIMGVAIPEVTMPVAAGRNIGVLIECAVRNQLLKQKGYDASAELAARQANLIEKPK